MLRRIENIFVIVSILASLVRYLVRRLEMKTHALLITAAILAAPIYAADNKSPEVDTAAAFAKLKSLTGVWEAKVDGKTARLTYELTGAGTTLIETEGGDAHPGMMTMYHLNGSRLMLTHYCMAGNQPRMQAKSYDAKTGELQFRFLDATNLKTPNDGHMHNATIRIIDHDHLVSEWEFYENGKKKFGEAAEYTRVK
jgi:hypothetical protein